jgi:hypothetical protein
MWKELAMVKSKYQGIYLKEYKSPETSVRTSGALAGIRTEHLPNTSWRHATAICSVNTSGNILLTLLYYKESAQKFRFLSTYF